MRQVDIAEAKTALSDLVDAVRAGEDVIIERDGLPVAQLVQPKPTHDRARAEAALTAIRVIAAGLTLGPEHSVRTLIDDGRRY